jgi:hypothetical protein
MYSIGFTFFLVSWVFWLPDSFVEYKKYKENVNKLEGFNDVGFSMFSIGLACQLNWLYLFRNDTDVTTTWGPATKQTDLDFYLATSFMFARWKQEKAKKNDEFS